MLFACAPEEVCYLDLFAPVMLALLDIYEDWMFHLLKPSVVTRYVRDCRVLRQFVRGNLIVLQNRSEAIGDQLDLSDVDHARLSLELVNPTGLHIASRSFTI